MRVTIKNFQSIKQATFDIKDFTIFVGPTNRGKSALVRALRSVFYNDWHPSYMRDGEEETVIFCEFNDFSEFPIESIERRINKDVNSYLILHKDGTDKEYKKIGRKVPDEVTKYFKIIEDDRGTKHNLNFQSQLESLFLVSKSEVLVTSFFNSMFKITDYELVLRKMGSDKYSIKSYMKTLEEDILSNSNDKKDLEEKYVKLSEKLDYLKRSIKILDDSYNYTVKVKNILDNYFSYKLKYEETFKKLDEAKNVEKEIYKIHVSLDNLVLVKSKLSDMCDLKNSLNNSDEKFKNGKIIYGDLSDLHTKFSDVIKIITDTNTYSSIYFDSEGLEKKKKVFKNADIDFDVIINSLGSMLDIKSYFIEFNSIQNGCSSRESDLEKNKKLCVDLDSYEKEFKRLVKICPTCGNMCDGEDCESV